MGAYLSFPVAFSANRIQVFLSQYSIAALTAGIRLLAEENKEYLEGGGREASYGIEDRKCMESDHSSIDSKDKENSSELDDDYAKFSLM